MQDAKLKPANRYIAKAIEKGLYRGQFAIPGHTPDYVMERGRIKEFVSADAAELAAARTALKMANDRLELNMRFEKARPMTAEELSSILTELELSPTEAVHLLQNDYVMAWLNGDRRVPHMARIILELMRDDKIRNQIAAITAAAAEKG